MALIPMKQAVVITRKGVEDEWGDSTSATFVLKCRVDERTEVVRNHLGEEVVSAMEVTFDKLPDIRVDDIIEYTNEFGVKYRQNPQKIEPVRMLNGKAVMTTVYL